MDGTAKRILNAVAKNGELPLDVAIRLPVPRHRDHLDQYPLALLIEEGYVGMTLAHSPPPGAEKMREFALATMLHMLGLRKDERGEVHYIGIVSSGSVDPKTERVFIKAKGSLYLDEARAKRRERIYSFILGLFAGVLVAVLSKWLGAHIGIK